MPDELTMVHVGNTYLEHPMSVNKEPGFLKLLELMRGSDATVANMECTIHDGTDWPAFGGGMGWAGTYMPAPPSMIDELKLLGIDAIYAANNHTPDFGENGILTTVKHLNERGLAFAGIGPSLTEASAPCFVESTNGRVAIISACDWGPRLMMELPFPWPAGFMPSDELPPFRSRPGVNLVRYDVVIEVDRAAFDQLRRISGEFQWERGKVGRRGGGVRTEPLIGPSLIGYEKDTDTEFFFMGRKFVLGDKFKLTTFAFEEDLERMYRVVREARRQADVVIFGLHDQSHANGVTEFIDVLAHGVIDEGADLYINHGGRSRGIEFYKGKPIVFGMPGFDLQQQLTRRLPASMLMRLGLPMTASPHELLDVRAAGRAAAADAGGFLPPGGPTPEPRVLMQAAFHHGGAFKEIRLYPVGAPLIPSVYPRRGVPRLLEPGSEESDRALAHAVELSKPFGTQVEVRDGVGYVRPPESTGANGAGRREQTATPT
jgi:poly-gamma-glutamate capsule biosynthesis protein CapA/YwtB (metallophosphatase superfamily)